MKCAVVGTGFGAVHVAWLQSIQGVEVDSLVYGSDQPKAEAMKTKHSIPRMFDNMSEALGAGDLDLVSIVSPPETHAACIRTAIEAGVPVVIDKPLAQNLPDAEAIHALVGTIDRPVYVFFQWRLHAAVLTLKSLLDQSALGAVSHIDATFEHDFLAANETLWPWRHQYTTAGAGSLGDMGVHLFDLIRFVTGEEWIVDEALTGVAHPCRQMGDQKIDCIADDFAQVSLRTIRGSMSASVKTSRVSLGHRSITLRVYGDAGIAAVDLDPETGTASMTTQMTGLGPRSQKFESSNPYEPILDALQGHSISGALPAHTADGLAAQKLMTAAVLAAQPCNQPRN